MSEAETSGARKLSEGLRSDSIVAFYAVSVTPTMNNATPTLTGRGSKPPLKGVPAKQCYPAPRLLLPNPEGGQKWV